MDSGRCLQSAQERACFPLCLPPGDSEALPSSSQETAQPVARFDCPCLLPFQLPHIRLVRSVNGVLEETIQDAQCIFLFDNFGKCAGAICKVFMLEMFIFIFHGTVNVSTAENATSFLFPCIPPTCLCCEMERGLEVVSVLTILEWSKTMSCPSGHPGGIKSCQIRIWLHFTVALCKYK